MTSSGVDPAGAKCMTRAKRSTVRCPRANSACTRSSSGSPSSCALDSPAPSARKPTSPAPPKSCCEVMGHSASRYTPAGMGTPAGCTPRRALVSALDSNASSSSSLSPPGRRPSAVILSWMDCAMCSPLNTGSSSSQRSSSSSCLRCACECSRISACRSVSRRFTWTCRGMSLLGPPAPTAGVASYPPSPSPSSCPCCCCLAYSASDTLSCSFLCSSATSRCASDGRIWYTASTGARWSTPSRITAMQ
mmetsp:Transcript_2966/g.7194  ORF Transcript_2966/g.7194 Transcript_2966/m.7194 type:complete len:248 (-) Transcript_2966:369-1112(-)